MKRILIILFSFLLFSESVIGQVTKIANVEQLRKRKGSPNAIVELQGYYEVNDGAGQPVIWKANSTKTDNGGTVFQVSGVSVGRWESLESKEIINIYKFGLKNNDPNFDNSIVINKAIQQKKEDGGGIVRLPAGLYYAKTKIKISSFVTLQGDTKWNLANSFNYVSSGEVVSYNATIIKLANNSNSDLIEFDSLCVSAGIQNVFFDGNKTFQTSGNGISFKNHSTKIVRGSNKLDDVYVYNCKQKGVVINDKVYEVYLNKVYTDRNDDVGLYIAGQDCSLTDVLSGYNNSYGIEVTFGGALRSYNCDVFGNAKAGLYVHDVKSCRFFGLQSNGNKQEGILIANETSYSPSRIQFIGCSFFGNSLEFLTSTIRYPEFSLHSPTGGGPFGILLTGCVFGIYGGTNYCNYAVSDTSPTVRVNSIIGCHFESTVYATSLFRNIDTIYQIQGNADSVNGLVDTVPFNSILYTKVGSSKVAVESMGYDYKSSSFTVDPAKRFIAVNAFVAPVTITLPPANSVVSGKEVIIRKHDATSNAVSLITQGSDVLVTGTSNTITSQGGTVRIVSDGISNWFSSSNGKANTDWGINAVIGNTNTVFTEVKGNLSINSGINTGENLQVTGNAIIKTGNLEISDSSKGPILKSPNGTRWLIKVNDSGVLIATAQ